MYPEWSFGTVIVVILLCFVVLLNLVASAVTVFFDKQKEKHQQSILKEQNRNAIYSPSTILCIVSFYFRERGHRKPRAALHEWG